MTKRTEKLRDYLSGKVLPYHASVASFFLICIDVVVDAQLDQIAESQPPQAAACHALRGQAAIASAAEAYRHFREITAGSRWQALAQAGAPFQRLLWASTGVKDPSYSAVKYVEPLIAPQTVNTLPPETLAAYREQGEPQLRIDQAIADAPRIMQGLADLGIELQQIDDQLEEEGIEKFVSPYHKLLVYAGHLERLR